MVPLKAVVNETQSKPTSILAGVKRGKQSKPVRVLLQGVEGIGKSTFAADAPEPIFLCAEDGVANLDVSRLPEPKTWDDVQALIRALIEEDHSYKTLVIDTVDWLEPLIVEHVCRAAKVQHIEDVGAYGRGYAVCTDMWRQLLSLLDTLRDKRGMHVILLAHAAIKPYQNPTGENYDRYALKLHKGPAGLLKEWADCVLFAAYESAVVGEGKKAKGVSTGARLLHTTWRAAWDAKNRFGLPDDIPLNWGEFWTAVQGSNVTTLIDRIKAMASGTPYEEKCNAFIAKNATNAAELNKLADWLNGKLLTGGM